MSLDAQMEALERESDRWLFSNPERYRQLAMEMVALARGAGPASQARAHRAQGNALRVYGDLGGALRAVRRALRAWRRAGDEVEWARTQTTLIPILAQMGQNRQALAASRAGLAVFLRLGLDLPAARLLSNTGGIYLYTGQTGEALNCFLQAVELAAKAGDRGLSVRIDLHVALALQALGRHREALRRCARALRPVAGTRQTLHAARVLVAAAVSYFQLGLFGKALRRFAKARTLFEREGAQRDVAECDLHICACYLELNRYTPALGRIEAFLQQPGRAWFELAWALYYQGVALARLERHDEARAVLRRAARLFVRHGDYRGAGQARLEEAELLLKLGEARGAARLASGVQRDLREKRFTLDMARAALILAAVALETGHLVKAERQARQAQEIARRAHIPGLLFRAMHQLGQVALRRRQFDLASKHLSGAVRLAEQMRATVQLEFRRAFLADKAATYADLVWVRLQQGKVKAAYELMEQAKSRALADYLASPITSSTAHSGSAEERLHHEMESARREYQQLTLPAQLAATATGARTLQDVDMERLAWLEQRLGALWDEWELRRIGESAVKPSAMKGQPHRLQRGEAMIEYMIVQDRLIAFGSDWRGLRGWVELGPIEEIRRSLELLQLNLDATLNMQWSAPLLGLTRNANRLLRDLYERIWAPLPWLAGIDRVFVVPHGPLHQIPFCALHDGDQYLVERIELTLAPSRTVRRQCRERALIDRARVDRVLGYNPSGQLPFVETEAIAVAEKLGTVPWIGERADTVRVTDGGPYRVLHLAVHGQFRPDNPEFSTLLLADGSLTAADVTAQHIKASLVTLSACETGLSRVSNGEELTGLITAFLTAGSTSTLASLWRVDDAATAELMLQFYQELLAGSRKSAALRRAQIDLLRKKVHPLYWAGFSIMGDGGRLSVPIIDGGD